MARQSARACKQSTAQPPTPPCRCFSYTYAVGGRIATVEPAGGVNDEKTVTLWWISESTAELVEMDVPAPWPRRWIVARASSNMAIGHSDDSTSSRSWSTPWRPWRGRFSRSPAPPPGRRCNSLSLDGVTTATVALEGSRRQCRGQVYVAVAWSTVGVLQGQLTLDTSTKSSAERVRGRRAAGLCLVVEQSRTLTSLLRVEGRSLRRGHGR
jgi:hypothetical protein